MERARAIVAAAQVPDRMGRDFALDGSNLDQPTMAARETVAKMEAIETMAATWGALLFVSAGSASAYAWKLATACDTPSLWAFAAKQGQSLGVRCHSRPGGRTLDVFLGQNTVVSDNLFSKKRLARPQLKLIIDGAEPIAIDVEQTKIVGRLGFVATGKPAIETAQKLILAQKSIEFSFKIGRPFPVARISAAGSTRSIRRVLKLACGV